MPLRPAQVGTWPSSKKQCGAAYLIYYEQSLCLSCWHTEQRPGVQSEQLWTSRSKTSQNQGALSHSSCTSQPEASHICPLDCPAFLLGPAGIIGHLEAFMSSFLFIYFIFNSSPFEEERPVPAAATTTTATAVQNKLHWTTFFYLINPHSCGLMR